MEPAPQDTAARHVSVQLLGGFAVSLDGRPVPDDAWPGRRAAELVQILALARNRRMVADQVIDALWPHLSPQAGAANLRKAAHHVRRAVGDTDAIVLRGGCASLFPNAQVTVDADVFETIAAEALTGGDPDHRALIDAIDCYTGDLLPDAPYEEWTQVPRRQLRHRYVELLRAAGLWERLITVEPTDEAAYRQLMSASLENGDPHGAIRWYGRLRTTLLKELGVAPARETDRLYERCVAALGSRETTFVGRDLELAEATAALRRSAETASTIVVRGPPGIGKSAFCRRLVASAQHDGWFASVVDAHEAGEPYGPLTSIVEQLVPHNRALLDTIGPRARSVLAELTPLAGPAGTLDGPVTRHQVIGALRRLLTAASDVAGAIVLVDDAHAADEATIDAVFHLASAGPHPLVVVVAYRSEQAPSSLMNAVDRLRRAGRAEIIDLTGLDEEESGAIVAGTATRTLDPSEIARIVELGEGNPFFLIELTRQATRDPDAPRARTVWDAIRSRFTELDDTAAAVVRNLALAGDDFGLAAVLALTGLDEEDAFALLDTALSAGILVVTGDRYRFRHALVRQALIEELAPHQRVVVHRNAARRLTDLGARPATIAHHWLAGGRPDAAAPWLLAAARQAFAVGAHLDAVAHVDTMLDHAPSDADALTLRAESLDALGDPRAPSAYASAALVDTTRADDLRAKQALAQLKLGDPPGALATAEGLEPTTLDGRLALALTLSGAAAIGFGDPAVGSAQAAEARRLAIRSGDAAAVLVASWAYAAAAHARGELRDSVQADLVETAPLQTLATTVFDGQLCITQRLLYGARPYADVVTFADALAGEAQRLGAARGHAFAVTLRGEAELLAGQLDAADADLVRGAALHRTIGGATGEALAVQRRAEVALHRGLFDDAGALAEEALAIARESDVGFHLFDRIYGTKIAAAAETSAALAAVEEAETAVRGPVETCPGCRITFTVPAAVATARAGDIERAMAYLEATEMLATVVMRLPAWHAALEEVRGHVAMARHRHDDARRHFADAAARFAAVGQPLDEQRCARLSSDAS